MPPSPHLPCTSHCQGHSHTLFGNTINGPSFKTLKKPHHNVTNVGPHSPAGHWMTFYQVSCSADEKWVAAEAIKRLFTADLNFGCAGSSSGSFATCWYSPLTRDADFLGLESILGIRIFFSFKIIIDLQEVAKFSLMVTSYIAIVTISKPGNWHWYSVWA